MATVSFADAPKPASAARQTPATAATTCSTCRVSFSSVDELRKHYSSEWHSENVRRRVDSKRPLTLHEFRAGGGDADLAVDGDASAGTFYSCSICNRHFKSIQTLQSHVRSTEHLLMKEKRILARDSDAASALTSTSLGSAAIGLHRRAKTHKAAAKKYQDPFKEEAQAKTKRSPQPTPEDREADVDETRCFFCGLPSTSMEANLAHMEAVHNFTLPLEHRIKDKLGLMRYISRKINGLMCLVCNDDTKQIKTLEGLRAHMRAKHHEYLLLTSEYNEFYEGTLDDGVAAPVAETELSDKLVLSADGSKRVIRKREAEVPVPRHREAESQQEQRRLIAAQATEAQAVIRRERFEAEHKQAHKEHKIIQQQHRRQQRFSLLRGMQHSKAHPKGYDGEGEVN